MGDERKGAEVGTGHCTIVKLGQRQHPLTLLTTFAAALAPFDDEHGRDSDDDEMTRFGSGIGPDSGFPFLVRFCSGGLSDLMHSVFWITPCLGLSLSPPARIGGLAADAHAP